MRLDLSPDLTRNNVNAIIAGQQWGYLGPGSSATVMAGSGSFDNGTSTDASSVRGLSPDGAFFSQTSAATTGSNCGTFQGEVFSQPRHLPEYTFAIAFDAVTSVRIFIGLIQEASELANALDSNTLGAPGIGIQFSTPRGDTSFQAVSNGGSQTVTTLGVTPVANTLYIFRVKFISTSLATISIYSKTGVLLGSVNMTSNLPSSTQGMVAVVGVETEENVAKTIYHFHWYARNFAYQLT